MVTGNDILGYQGNVGLGLSEGGGITSYGELDTKDLSQQVFNMAYVNMQKNKAVWEQKIKDRDEGMAAIAAGKLDINTVLPQHRAEMEKQIDGIKKIYFDNGGDVKSDPKVWLDLQDKLSKFNSANLSAKSNLDTYNKGLLEASTETNPAAKKRMLDHWKEESKKTATQIFEPYQKTLDWDPNKVGLGKTEWATIGSSPSPAGSTTVSTTTKSGGTTTRTSTTAKSKGGGIYTPAGTVGGGVSALPAGKPAADIWGGTQGSQGAAPYDPAQGPVASIRADAAPVSLIPATEEVKPQTPANAGGGSYRDGNFDVTRKRTDIPQAWLQYSTSYLNDDLGTTAPNIDEFHKNFYGLNNLEPKEVVNERIALMNEKLLKIAQMEGYKTATNGDIAALPKNLRPVVMRLDTTDGVVKPIDTVPMAAFKAALVNKYQNGEVRTYNDDYAKDTKNKAEVGKLYAEIEGQKALAAQRRSFIPYNQARAKYWNSKGTAVDNSEKVANVFKDVMDRRKVVTFNNFERKQVTDAKGNKTWQNVIVGTTEKTVVYVGDMPKGFGQVLAGIDKDGKPIPLTPLLMDSKLPNGEQAAYYEVGLSPFYNSPSGTRYSEAQIATDYARQNKFTSLDDFKAFLSLPKAKGGAGFEQEKELIGSNGRGTAQATIEALRTINNKSKNGKGDEIISQEGDNNQDQTTQ